MLLLVGLGNPGPGHAGDRHNIGYMAADAIVRRHGFGPYRAKFKGVTADGSIADEKVAVLKPETYMNLSGESVAAAAHFYKLAPEQVIVIHDEIDLAFGKLRVKQGGGSGGHNGLRSIDGHLGPDYWRVRLGVGHPGIPELVIHHVLRPFAKEELPSVEKLVDAVADAIPLLIAGDANRFMSKVDVVMNPRPPKEKPSADSSQQSAGADARPPKADA
jgi:peptidyl-tRNA hydrolase, PTH1 family